MELIGDQALDFVPVIVEVGEEPLHPRLELGEGGKILIVNRGFLEQPPETLDQVQVRRIGRQVNQLDTAVIARSQALTSFEWL